MTSPEMTVMSADTVLVVSLAGGTWRRSWTGDWTHFWSEK